MEVQRLVLVEFMEMMVPMTYTLVYSIAYFGPNALLTVVDCFGHHT